MRVSPRLPLPHLPSCTESPRLGNLQVLSWGRTYQLGMWLNAMVSTMSQEKMSRKARDKELQLGLKFSMLMKQRLSITTAKTFLCSLLKLKQEKKNQTWRIIC